MPSKTYNKAVINGVTYIDLSSDTVTADKLLSGYTAHDKNGEVITGTATSSSVVVSDTIDAAGGTIRTITAQEAVYLQEKTITPTSSQQIVNPDTGYDGFSKVTVEAGGGSPTLQTITKTYTPTESQQTETITAGTGYDGIEEVDVTVNAISSSYVGSGVARKSSSDLTASGATVTAPAGYYTSNATKTISSGSATPAASISGTSASVSTGTNTLTLTKTVSNTPQVSAGYISSGTAGNTSLSLTASINTRSSSDLTASNLTVTAPSGYYGSNASKTLTDSNLVAGNIKKNVVVFGVTGSYEGSGGGGSSVKTGTQTSTAMTAGILRFYITEEVDPTSFVVTFLNNIGTSSPATISTVVYDGTNLFNQSISTTSNANVSYANSGISKSYSDGYLTLSSSTNYFSTEGTYKIVYSYDGSSANINTADVQVGSGATSITFTGLEDEPVYWSCAFKSNFSTSSGYQRVITVVYDGTDIYGLEMDSSAKYSTSHWTSSYNNGSLTITSQGTNAGGYFHQPGYYQLTYAIGGEIEIEIEPLTVTTNGTYQESGKAYSPVTVNVSGGGSSVQYDTKTVTASNYPLSLDFTSMKGQPKFFVVRLNAQVSSSGNTTYYYIVDITSNGTTTHGNCFRIGSTRRVDNITSGYSWSYSGTTLTVTSSAASRSASPGAFYSGSYELMYAY